MRNTARTVRLIHFGIVAASLSLGRVGRTEPAEPLEQSSPASAAAAPAVPAAAAPDETVTSLLGETLAPVPIAPEKRAELEAKLADAAARLEREPESEFAAIWYGRRLAYLGRYREAIDAFTRGIEKHPESPRLFRHRGHRYITIREFDKAIADLQEAAWLVGQRQMPDEIEEDGAPNLMNIPRSTLHTNIYYHLGIAWYLKGHWGKAFGAFRGCSAISGNDDMRVACWNWLILSGRRLGAEHEKYRGMAKGDEENALRGVAPIMEIYENAAYHDLLLFDKGELTREQALKAEEGNAIDAATRAYGVGVRLLIEGKTDEARALFERALATPNWAAFGRIAAEAELARMRTAKTE